MATQKGHTVIWLNYWRKEKRLHNQTVRNITVDRDGRFYGQWIVDGGSTVNVTKTSTDAEWKEV